MTTVMSYLFFVTVFFLKVYKAFRTCLMTPVGTRPSLKHTSNSENNVVKPCSETSITIVTD